ncbi:MAG: T9SS type A sorting domain-containing protein, partial [Candidatus Kapabacteria bacterium]|nr:T9SS type A sorting domain-containing protein [Candidatus Kapabacteria bacterium]
FAPTPNPVQNSAVISYIVPEMANVKITMSDATGISNIILTEGMHNEGTYTINFDAAQYNLASGTYFYFLESNGVKIAQKMVVVR